MKAVAINQYGGREQLGYTELPNPIVGPRDVLVEVRAAAVNPVDIAIREGYLQERLHSTFPLVLGWDVSGIVKEVGEEVTNFKPGDEVYSYPELTRNGTYAEYVTIDESYVAEKPSNLSFIEAASIPLAVTAAWRALVEMGNVKAGQRVLILGGSGGVGSLAVQLAKSLGAYVASTTSTKNLAFVKGLGVDEVFDYTKDFPFPNNEPFDLVFDTVGRSAFLQGLGVLGSGGKLLSIATFPTSEDQLMAKTADISLEFFVSSPDGKILKQVTKFLEENRIRPVVENVFSLDEIGKAHELSESKHARGKIVVTL